MAQDNKPLDMDTLLGDLFAAQRAWERRHKKLTERMAARILLHDLPKFQPRWCGGTAWPKWMPILTKILKGECAIGGDAEEHREPPPGESLNLLGHLVRAVGKAEHRLVARTGASGVVLELPPLREYVIARMEKKCDILFDDPKSPDFEDRLEEYCGDNDSGSTPQDRKLLSNRITELDNAGFADDLLAELWTRFPRQCRWLRKWMGFRVPKGVTTTSTGPEPSHDEAAEDLQSPAVSEPAVAQAGTVGGADVVEVVEVRPEAGDNVKHEAPEVEWSLPMTGAEAARRLLGWERARFRDVEQSLSSTGIQKIERSYKMRIRLDTLSASDRKKLEKQV